MMLGNLSFIPSTAIVSLCKVIAAGGCIAFGATVALAQPLLIKNAEIFPATEADPYRASVLIKNGRIARIERDIDAPADATIIDANGMALLPGLIDIHTHWAPEGEPNTFPEIATRYVLSGVTTVNDFHAAPESYRPKRDYWLQALITPHVNYAARISTPGGHGAVWGDTNMTRWVSTPAEGQLAIEQLLPYQPDVIKIFMDGWRYGSPVDNTSMNEDAVAALAAAAHSHQLRVMAHVVTVARAKIAGRAGVDVIVHALQDTTADAELIALMKERRIIYSPSLAVYEPKPEKLVGLSTETLAWVRRRQAFSLYNLRTFRDAGIPIALGTDAGMEATPHGSSTLRELELMVAGGLTPAEALRAGTQRGALAMGLERDRGTVEVGKRADLILVVGKPWQNIADIRHLNTVFIDGRMVARNGALVGAQPGAVPPAVKAGPLIDDFERADGRSSLDTLRLDNRDAGVGRSTSISQIVLRAPGDRALSLVAAMAVKKNPEAGVIIPFNRGAVVPVDASAFRGVRFDIRGDGQYKVGINTASGQWCADVTADGHWRTLEVPFALLRSAGKAEWSAEQLLSVEFGGSRPAGAKMWMEIDNVQFY